VSVVIPCYNYGHYIKGCVDSVLRQPGVSVDVLVIDDASPDGSADVVRTIAGQDSRVRAIYHERNRGHIATYNEGLSQADGDYVVLLSADDLLAPGALARATALMESNPGVGLVYGPVTEFTTQPPPPARPDAASWTVWRGQDWLRDRCRTGRNALLSPEAVMRTSVLRAVGGYKTTLPHAGDFEMWMQAASISDVGYIGGVAQAYYRIHQANMHSAVFDVAAKGRVTDLQQRYACFRSVLAGNTRVAGAPALLRMASRALAREALTLAVRGYDSGQPEAWPVRELAGFAAEIVPAGDLRWARRALARRGAAGAARRQRLAVVAGGQMYKMRWRVVSWRWRFAGV
jgi:glycosyltransferase involved in cell wall biosynthesis